MHPNLLEDLYWLVGNARNSRLCDEKRLSSITKSLDGFTAKNERTIYISVEQEALLRRNPQLSTWAGENPETDKPLHMHYVVVSVVPWDRQHEPGWVPTLIGPFNEQHVLPAMQSIKFMLRSMGFDAIEADEEAWKVDDTDTD